MIRYQKDTDNIVTLIMDMSERGANVINHEIGDVFVPVIAHLKHEKSRGALRGVILTSAKKSFLAGGDLEYLYRAEEAEEIFRFCEKMKKFLRDLESPGVPVVAALNGDALGAGFEVALACHHRIIIDNPGVSVGLPEVQIGLMPGAGGSIRLMWLLGIEKAYPVLSGGLRYNPQEALRAGIIDELATSRKDMLEKAKAWLMKTHEGRRPWDREGHTIPGGSARDPHVAAWFRQHSAEQAAAGPYNPAKQAILSVLYEGSKVDFDTACRIESRYYTGLLRSRSCKNMIKAFWFDYNSIRSGINRPKGFGRFRPRKVGVIGAGQMGSGIALACLTNGLEVVIKDISRLVAERGRDYVRNYLNQQVAQGIFSPAERDTMLQRVKTTDDPHDFSTCDLVIEAVFENQMVKQKVTKEAEIHMDEYSIFGTNTISIPISKLAAASVRPAHYIGLHFFHPAEDVPLVEIVRGAKTSDETVARAFDFVTSIGKIPIVVKDDWGFYVARVQNTYLLEGVTMLKEGYPPALVEHLGRQAGMPKGALALADDLGLALVLHYERQAAEHYGARYIQHPAVSALEMMLNDLQRPGRAKKAGFYEYEENGDRRLWEELGAHFPAHRPNSNNEELVERFLFAQVIEAVWCMQEHVIHTIPGANLGSIYGWGFPATSGGVIQFIADYGAIRFLERCKLFEQRYGPRFKAPKLLGELALGNYELRIT
ncbi:MAG: enoyl-CoA hydratase/isomerase family protein [Saprospiraceae bacterium]|nr:enoyl-CoA hydratase/isomerase family protein [Saprospiraceae bacterium]